MQINRVSLCKSNQWQINGVNLRWPHFSISVHYRHIGLFGFVSQVQTGLSGMILHFTPVNTKFIPPEFTPTFKLVLYSDKWIPLKLPSVPIESKVALRSPAANFKLESLRLLPDKVGVPPENEMVTTNPLLATIACANWLVCSPIIAMPMNFPKTV